MTQGNKAKDPAVVDLYRVAYNAGRPVTFAELVDGLPSAYQNDANRAYAKYRDEEGDDPIPDPWSRRQLRTALEWWVRGIIDHNRKGKEKHFIATLSDGSPLTGRPVAASEVVYTANRDKPPTVMEQVLVARPTKWTPEIGATGRRHVAGIKFRDQMARIEPLGSKVAIKDRERRIAELEEALELATEALSHGTRVEN
jgi:hypothetical protein